MSIFAIIAILLATICVHLFSTSSAIASESLKISNVTYSRYLIEFPSEISWIIGKSSDSNINESISFNSSHARHILLVVQTLDGNIHTLDVPASSVSILAEFIDNPNITTFKANASGDNGGPTITDLDKDNNYEVVSTSVNGSLVVIDYPEALTLYNDRIKFSPQTQIVPYTRNLNGEGEFMIGVSANGTLIMIKPVVEDNLNGSALPPKLVFKVIKTNFTNLLSDGRIVVNDIDNRNNNVSNEIFILTDPIDAYPHGALGDIIEPTKVISLEHCRDNNSQEDNVLCLKEILPLPRSMEVFETIKPVIAEYANGTGVAKAIAMVASGRDVGSATFVYDSTSSSIIYSSEPIGQGFRWLLVLGSVMVTNNQSILVINETPHLSGIVKFVDIVNNKTLSVEGFSAHDYGSRNIEMYTISDLDKDGQDDLVIPTLNKLKIAILSLQENIDNAVHVDDDLILNDKLSSNIVALDINYDGYQDIIVGDKSGNLYIFASQTEPSTT